ncbi:MAG: methylmalonyl-CoA mutase, partial [Bacteroidetes bacterium]|nr:methylmalonyl-CoA mutase [Bacteroidota bacterium]
SAIKKKMEEVNAQRGIVKAVASGEIQKTISQQAYEREKAIQGGSIPKVGVNCFKKDEETKTVEFHPYNEENALKQIARLNKIKKQRDSQKVKECLGRIKKDAKEKINLMPSVIEAVKAYATVGEITKTLKDVYGEYKEPIYF